MALNHLVVLIPGIGGSELVDPTLSPDERRVWYSGLGSITRAVVDPDRLRVDQPLTAVGLLKDFSVVPFFKSIDGYNTAWSTLTSTFPKAPTDLGNPDRVNVNAQIVAFPYDFRLGIENAAAQLAATIHPRIEALGGRTSVVVVGHSMGGLVARRWASHHDPDRRCRGIITLGTPFRGAPKALDVLTNGLYWGTRLLQRRKLSAVVQNWRGVHDLVPIDDRIRAGSDRWHAAWELPDLPGAEAIRSARDQHVETRSWWTEPDHELPTLLAVSGHGHGTASTITWKNGRIKLDKTCLPGERDGDGTVPEFSSIPPEWSGSTATTSRRPCGDSHGAISHTGRLREYLLLLNSGDPPPVRGAGDDEFLGFDTDAIVEPGDVLDGALRLNGQNIASVNSDGTHAVTATLSAEDGSEHRLNVEPGDADRFVIELPAGVEGVVRLEAKVDSPDGRKRATERVIVLGAEE